MKPVYSNQPINKSGASGRGRRSRQNRGTPPTAVLAVMTFVLACMFVLRGVFPDGGETGDTGEEAAYAYGEFDAGDEYLSDETEETDETDETDETCDETGTVVNTAASDKRADINNAFYVSGALPVFADTFADNVIENKADKPRSAVSVFPLDGEITSYFGTRDDPFGSDTVETHLGIDIAGGTAVYACADGVVETVSRGESYGNYVVIRHNDEIESLYAHCAKIYVSEGESVSAGDNIARAGMTGSATGVHLHFEIRVNGERVDPLDYVRQ